LIALAFQMKRSPIHYAFCNPDAGDLVEQLISAGASQALLDMVRVN